MDGNARFYLIVLVGISVLGFIALSGESEQELGDGDLEALAVEPSVALEKGNVHQHHHDDSHSADRHGDATSLTALGDECRANRTASEVCLPDGEKVGIQWRSRPTTEFPSPPFQQHLASLEERALSGDLGAALARYQVTEHCKWAYREDAELEEAVEALHQHHTFQSADMPDPVPVEPTKVAGFERILRQNFEHCRGVPEEEDEEHVRWLELAVEGSSPYAMITYGERQENVADALTYYEEAWELGEAAALPMLADAYQHMYDTGTEPEDKVLAFATFSAYTAILEAGTGPGTGHGQIAAREIARARAALEERSVELQAYEVEEATQIAKKIIEENSLCCFEM